MSRVSLLLSLASCSHYEELFWYLRALVCGKVYVVTEGAIFIYLGDALYLVDGLRIFYLNKTWRAVLTWNTRVLNPNCFTVGWQCLAIDRIRSSDCFGTSSEPKSNGLLTCTARKFGARARHGPRAFCGSGTTMSDLYSSECMVDHLRDHPARRQ